ncbi:phosphotransferase family protein [Cryptosporangium sp. NPDC048952]|uniref:phosphotransferase family protein n=1 Tax=Cryptosporangium sp. NPDC048952 TaxID=3363961 RepID=UPI00370F7786
MAVRQAYADPALLADLTERMVVPLQGWRPDAKVLDVRPLTGGNSSLTFLVDLGGVAENETPIVLKVAPPGLEPVRNRDVLRQARLQAALRAAGRPPAPAVLFTDAGAPPFMAMNFVPGECVEPILRPVDERPAPGVVRDRYLAAARALGDLHEITPASVGAGDEPVIDLRTEIGRWTRAFGTLPPEMQGNFERAGDALLATVPEPLPPVLTHGDYRLGNTLCEADRLEAIIDWEIWSVGDPRVDLTWFLFFTDDAGHLAAEPGPPAGTPTQAELVREYERHRGVTVPDLEWFHALTRYKEAAATGLLLKRAAKHGFQVNPAMARMGPVLPDLVEEVLEMVGR